MKTPQLLDISGCGWMASAHRMTENTIITAGKRGENKGGEVGYPSETVNWVSSRCGDADEVLVRSCWGETRGSDAIDLNLT